MEEVLLCPVCGSGLFRQHLACVDHALTKEIFTLKQCMGCALVITSPRPVEENLERYYQFPSYISHSGKSESGIVSLVYKSARYLALRWKRKSIERLSPGGRILDIGCGTGEFLNYMKRKGWSVAGVEPSSAARTKAEQLLNQQVYTSVDALSPNSYEVITLWHALEHIPNLQLTIQRIRQSLTQHGLLVIAVPNYEAHDAQKYGPHWAGYDVPRHLWHFNAGSMQAFLRNNEFSLLTMLPMKLDAFYVSLLSEQYRHADQPVKNFIRAFVTGALSNFRGRKQTNYSSLIFLARANS